MRAAIGSYDDEPALLNGNRSGGLGILPCEGTRLVLYTKDHARSKMRPLYVKIMVCRPFSCRSFIEEEKMEKSRFGRFPYITLAMFSSYFVSVSRYRST